MCILSSTVTIKHLHGLKFVLKYDVLGCSAMYMHNAYRRGMLWKNGLGLLLFQTKFHNLYRSKASPNYEVLRLCQYLGGSGLFDTDSSYVGGGGTSPNRVPVPE